MTAGSREGHSGAKREQTGSHGHRNTEERWKAGPGQGGETFLQKQEGQ